MTMAAMDMVSAGGFGDKLSFKKMSAWGRLYTMQENPTTIKVRPTDGTSGLRPLEDKIASNLH